MPLYEVNKDGANEALDPDGNNVKVSFKKKETRPEQEKSRTKKVLIIVLVAICLLVVLLLCVWFVYTIFESKPEWHGENFIIETIPGLRYHPENHEGETMIFYNASSPLSYRRWATVIDNELEDYFELLQKPTPNLIHCDYDRRPSDGEICVQDIKKWFPCVKENNYGYHKSSPCVFIRFNKITEWIPDFYSSPDSLPEEMQADLVASITRENQIFYKLSETVWLSCKGEDPIDVENLGPIRYIPRRGFPGFFFPYNNTENYLSPLVAVYFEKPQRGVVINVECRVWAKNIEYNKEKGIGFVHFELLVDY